VASSANRLSDRFNDKTVGLILCLIGMPRHNDDSISGHCDLQFQGQLACLFLTARRRRVVLRCDPVIQTHSPSGRQSRRKRQDGRVEPILGNHSRRRSRDGVNRYGSDSLHF
jgi:hypothetical protein